MESIPKNLVDLALQRLGQKRQIGVFTRHYQMPAMLTANKDLIATLPTRVARMQANNDDIVIKEPPFFIPEFELTMAWSPLLQHHPAHRWLRQLIQHVSRQIIAEERIKYPLQTAIQDGSLDTQPIDLVEIDPDRQ